MNTFDALENRRSTRAYLSTPVPEEVLAQIMTAGNKAPIAGRLHFSVVRDPTLLAEIDTKALAAMRNSGNAFLMGRAGLPGYQALYGAPVLVMVAAPVTDTYGMANAAAAATLLTLAATARGLGSCYTVTATLALADDPGLAQALHIPDDHQPMCSVLLGYAAPENAFATKRLETDNIVYIDA